MGMLRCLAATIAIPVLAVFTLLVYHIAYLFAAYDEDLDLSSVSEIKNNPFSRTQHVSSTPDHEDESLKHPSLHGRTIITEDGTRRRRLFLGTAGSFCVNKKDCSGVSMLCIETKCTCPVMFSGAFCDKPVKQLTSELSDDHSLGPWCGIPFTHDELFPWSNSWFGKPTVEHNLGAILIQAVKPTRGTTVPNADLYTLGDFRSCGVVGSSGRLLKNNLGPEIDNHTAVFRFNDAPTRGFEPYVGSKGTVRVQNIEYCGFKERDGEILMHYTDPKRSHYERCTDHDIRKISPRMLMYSQTYFQKTRPPAPMDPTGGKVKMSGGFYGILLALHLCGEVKLYGFGQSNDHYYTKGRKGVGATPFQVRHAWEYEGRCLRLLTQSKTGKITADVAFDSNDEPAR
eukprot:CAMPEP_0198233248 /NCGR_PEP_ID=MMETSP1445-20131203/116142_1 /TAXON_ID=36898 /ORGANISM="Pyramimonas sp., Strain CCMP2087" /LENGTH=398 /DNA_ID=CAMNT_0043913939 /DNA_START=254 /DNA_END=1451 /DNA_ORIENTATION=+